MKWLNLPRQPFVGLAGMAGLGIILADFSPLPPSALLSISIVVAVCCVILLRLPMVIPTYAIVGLGFFLLHDLQTSDTEGQQLAAQLGNRPRVVTATGIVVSEPKIAPNGFATFLLRLESLEFEGGNERTAATWFVRWRGTPEYADELRLFGSAGVIAPPRNPDQFDMRTYPARHH